MKICNSNYCWIMRLSSICFNIGGLSEFFFKPSYFKPVCNNRWKNWLKSWWFFRRKSESNFFAHLKNFQSTIYSLLAKIRLRGVGCLLIIVSTCNHVSHPSNILPTLRPCSYVTQIRNITKLTVDCYSQREGRWTNVSNVCTKTQ